jgi:uncharacterized SAM-binding protein YcdF (DUF218 family)
MPLALDKILAALAFPLGSACVGVLVALAIAAVGWRRTGTTLAVLAVAWLWLWSTRPAADAITAALAERHPPTAVAALPQADAIVVLGGGMAPRAGDRLHADLGEAADRVWHAARLWHAGRAARVLLSGGLVWGDGPQTEAEAMAAFLVDLGVPAAAIVIEGESRNTRGNAVETAALLEAAGAGPVLLVTSATHMPRALATFRRAGVDAIPAATDYRMPDAAPLLLALLPDAGALADSTAALKEFLGLWVYRWRGWA